MSTRDLVDLESGRYSTQGESRFFGRLRIDVKAGRPLEAGMLRQPGQDFYVPVVLGLHVTLRDEIRRRVYDEVEGRVAQEALQSTEHTTQRKSEAFGVSGEGEVVVVAPRGDKYLERAARGEGAERNEFVAHLDDTLSHGRLALDRVADQARAVSRKVLAREIELCPHHRGEDRHRHDLRVGMVLTRASGGTVILERQHVFDALISRELDDASGVCVQQISNLLDGTCGDV